MTLVPNLRRHVYHITVCAIGTQERDDALLDILDALRSMEIVEGFAFEREDYTGYVAITKTRGLPSFSTEIPEAWLEE